MTETPTPETPSPAALNTDAPPPAAMDTHSPVEADAAPVHHTLSAETGYLDANTQAVGAIPTPVSGDVQAKIDADPLVAQVEPAHTSWGRKLLDEIERVLKHVLPHYEASGRLVSSSQGAAAVDAAHQALRGGDRAEIEAATENLKAHATPSA